MKTFFALVATLTLSIAPLITFAHGDTLSFETEVDGYLVDIGYSSETPSEEEVVLFDFALTSVSSEDEAAFSDVWVKIEDESGAIVFASGIHNAEFGGPRMSYKFPEDGTYTVSARYENESEAIVEVSFPLTVSSVADGGVGNYGFGIGGFLLGALLALTVLWRKSV